MPQIFKFSSPTTHLLTDFIRLYVSNQPIRCKILQSKENVRCGYCKIDVLGKCTRKSWITKLKTIFKRFKLSSTVTKNNLSSFAAKFQKKATRIVESWKKNFSKPEEFVRLATDLWIWFESVCIWNSLDSASIWCFRRINLLWSSF